MRIQATFSLYFASAMFIASIFVGGSLIYLIDSNSTEVLFQRKVFLIPTGLVIILNCILCGAVTGWIIGILIVQKRTAISASLLEIETGSYVLKPAGWKQRDAFYVVWE